MDSEVEKLNEMAERKEGLDSQFFMKGIVVGC